MNKLKKLFVISAFAALAPIKTFAFHGQDFFFNPYVATEAAWRTLSWENAYGDGHFKENFGNVNFIFGAQFHQYFAAEAGFQTTNRKQKQTHYPGEAPVGGGPVLGFQPAAALREAVTHWAEAELQGWHLNLLGLLPVPTMPDTTLYASIGLAWSEFKVSTVPVSTNIAAQHVTSWQSGNDTILRLGVGIKHMITNNFAARVFFNWEDTGSLEGSALVPLYQPQGTYTAKMKSSYLVGLGFYYQLCPHRHA